MKKALVMTFVLVLGLGLTAFADGVLSGVWDTDISLYPAASVFGDFIKSFTSKVDVDYTIGGFTFGMESKFGVLGLTGMDFEADGALGAFTFDLDLDFAPMDLKTDTITLAAAPTWGTPICCCQTYSAIVDLDDVSHHKTYGAAFDDLTAAVSVSIAGVNLGTAFFLEGIDSEYAETVTTFYATQSPSSTAGAATISASGTVRIADPTVYGAGWKFSVSGTFGGATLTGLAYFNLSETSTYDENAGYANVYLVDKFTKSGTYSIVCNDCVLRFSSAELLLEDVSFACTSFSALATFDCCGFSDVKFLLEDIGLGCCWDVNFDMLVAFDVDSKTIELEPDITLANACFTIEAAIVTTPATGGTPTQFELSGIDIRQIGLEYTWNGITFEADASFDLDHNPLLGAYVAGGIVSSRCKLDLWQPDRDKTTATFTFTPAAAQQAATCVASAATWAITNTSTGAGWYELTSISLERVKAWQKFKITVDGDSCCGGDFDISAAFYLGELEYLTDLDGVYWYDADFNNTYGTGEYYVFYGGGTYGSTATATPTAPTCSAYSADCYNCCDCISSSSCECACGVEVDEVKWYKTYSGKTDNRLFDWIETDVDVVIGVGSAFDLTFGMDIDYWGWEDFTFGFEFTF